MLREKAILNMKHQLI